MSWCSPLSGLAGGLAKAKRALDLRRNNNAEDLLPPRHAGNHVGHGLRWQRSASISCVGAPRVCGARAQSAPGLIVPMDTCIFTRDKTGLTMGKAEVNTTF